MKIYGEETFGMKKTILILLALSTAFLSAACGAGSEADSAYEAEMVTAETAAAYDEAGAVAQSVGSVTAESGFGAAPSANRIVEADKGSMGEAEYTSGPETGSRKLIKDVSMRVETEEFDRLTASIEEKAEALSGYVESSSVSGNIKNGETRWGHFTVRIPSERLDEFMDTAFAYANIISKNEQLTDITLKYTDTESRITALKTEQERLTELLSEAESAESLIVIEDRLSEIRYELQNFESQLRLYDNQVNYSTVRIDISEVKVLTVGAQAGVLERIGSGISKNMSGLGSFLENAVIVTVSFLPVAAVLGMVISGVYKAAKTVKNRRKNRQINKEGKGEGDEIQREKK